MEQGGGDRPRTSPADRPADNLGWPCYEGRGRRAGYDGANLAMCENLYTVKMAPARMLTSQTDTKIRWCRGSRARRAIPRWLGWPSTGAPLTRTVIVGSANSVGAPSRFVSERQSYRFHNWSDGGVHIHNIVAPATDTTYKATYRTTRR